MPMPEINLPPLSAIEELARYKQWVCWRYEARGDGKPTKVPMDPSTGFGASINRAFNWSTLEHALRTANRRQFDGVGFVLTARDPFVGIDLDNCIDAAGNLSALAQELIDLAETYAEISPSGKGIRIFAKADHFDSFVVKGRGVEAYASARYLTVTGNHIASVPAAINEAPETLRRIFALRDEVQGAPVERKIVPFIPRSEVGGPREAAYAKGAMSDEMAILASVTEGGRNHQLNISAMKLGQMVAGGLITEAEAVSACLDACEINGLLRDDGQRQCEKTTRSGMRKGMTEPRGVPREPERELITLGRTLDGTLINVETGEVADEDPPEEPRDLAWREPQGLVRDIAQWVHDTSLMPNWPLCLAASISVLALLTSRHIATPLNGQTHLYIAALGQTAIGKDRPLKAPGEILLALDRATKYQQFERLWATAKWKSETAIEEMVSECPARLATIDEIGQLFQRIYNRRASSHESGMASILRELWSVNAGNVVSTSARAGTPGAKLHSPALTVFGVATHAEFYSALDAGVTDNGMINRWLFIYADKRGEERDRAERREVPDDVVQRLLDLLPPGGMQTLGAGPQPLTVPGPCACDGVEWGEGACDLYVRRRNHFRDLADKDLALGSCYGRTAEMGLRLATLHALGRAGRSAKVEMQDLDWGMSMSRESARLMMADAESRMAQNEQQGHYKMILRIIGEAGTEGIKHRALYKRIDGRIRMQDVKNIIDMAIQSGVVEAVLHADDKPSRGPHPPRYVAKRGPK